jgi:hypothetical protein
MLVVVVIQAMEEHNTMEVVLVLQALVLQALQAQQALQAHKQQEILRK